MAGYRLEFTYENTKRYVTLDKAQLAKISCESNDALDEDSSDVIESIFNNIILPMVGNPHGALDNNAKVESFGFGKYILLYTHETDNEAKVLNSILNKRRG